MLTFIFTCAILQTIVIIFLVDDTVQNASRTSFVVFIKGIERENHKFCELFLLRCLNSYNKGILHKIMRDIVESSQNQKTKFHRRVQ